MCNVRKVALTIIVLVCFIGTIVRSFDPKEVQGPFFFRKGEEVMNMVGQEGKEDILENCSEIVLLRYKVSVTTDLFASTICFSEFGPEAPFQMWPAMRQGPRPGINIAQ